MEMCDILFMLTIFATHCRVLPFFTCEAGIHISTKAQESLEAQVLNKTPAVVDIS